MTRVDLLRGAALGAAAFVPVVLAGMAATVLAVVAGLLVGEGVDIVAAITTPLQLVVLALGGVRGTPLVATLLAYLVCGFVWAWRGERDAAIPAAAVVVRAVGAASVLLAVGLVTILLLETLASTALVLTHPATGDKLGVPDHHPWQLVAVTIAFGPVLAAAPPFAGRIRDALAQLALRPGEPFGRIIRAGTVSGWRAARLTVLSVAAVTVAGTVLDVLDADAGGPLVLLAQVLDTVAAVGVLTWLDAAALQMGAVGAAFAGGGLLPWLAGGTGTSEWMILTVAAVLGGAVWGGLEAGRRVREDGWLPAALAAAYVAPVLAVPVWVVAVLWNASADLSVARTLLGGALVAVVAVLVDQWMLGGPSVGWLAPGLATAPAPAPSPPVQGVARPASAPQVLPSPSLAPVEAVHPVQQSQVDPLRYRDLRAISRLVRTQPGAVTRVQDLAVTLHGHSPLAETWEDELARIGGVVRLAGEHSGPSGEPLGLGLVAEGAGELLITSQRAVFALRAGQSLHGAMADGTVLAFAIPWGLVDCVSRPRRKRLTDRIAGGLGVTLTNCSTAVVSIEVLPASALSAPPEARPVAKATAEGVLPALVRAAAATRLDGASEAERERLMRVAAGAWAQEGDELVAWISDPNEP